MNAAGLKAAQKGALAVGIAGLGLSAAGALWTPQQFFRSYLPAFLFWIGVPLGCWAFLMLHHLVGGRWGFMIQRLLEAAVRTFSLLAVLFVPLLVGMRGLYPWAMPGAAATDPFLAEKSAYLNPPFFVGRAIFYFAVWIVFGHLLHRWSVEQDRTGDPSCTARLQNLSGPGLVLFALTVTFAAIDWAMSLEPHWYSTIYGMIFMVNGALAALSFAVVVATLIADEAPLSRVVHPDRFHDLGNFMLALVMLWAYVGFSQFLVIWSENLQEEIPWYLKRTTGGWELVALALIAFQFVLPFVLLLSRLAKRRAQVLAGVALWILVMRWVDMLWLVAPAFYPGDFRLHWMDVTTLSGIGGVWVAGFLYYLGQSALLPLRDPRFAELVAQPEGAR